MAKVKASNEVSVENGSQVENVATNENVAVTTAASIEESKEELTESEKINKEIDDESVESEADAVETAKISETVENETIENIVETSTDERKGNEKFFAFDKKEARRFFIDKEHFVGVIFYKRLLIGIKASELHKVEDIQAYASTLFIRVSELIKSLRFEDVEYERFDIDEYKIQDGYDVGVMSIDVPYTAKTSIFINKIRNLLISQFPEITYLRSSSNVRTSIDVPRSNSVISGFVSFTSYDKRDGNKKVTARAATFLNEGLADTESVNNLNRYIISLSKINLVNENGIIHAKRDGSVNTERFMDYYQTFRNKVHGMIYTVSSIENGAVTVDRIHYFIHIRTKKICNTVIPYGIKIVTTKLDTITTNDMRDVFIWDESATKTGFIGNPDLTGTEPNVSNLLDDIEQIQSNIIDSIESANLQ